MGLETVLDINGSAMKAQMLRLEVLGSNIANVNVTRTPEGGPYRRKEVMFRSIPIETDFQEHLETAVDRTATGVEVSNVIEDQTPFKKKFDPDHPDAGPDGYVEYPNVDVVSEIVNVQEAARAYEANVAVLVSIKSMITKTFEIGRR